MTPNRRRTILSAGRWCEPASGFRAFGAGIVLLGHVLLATRTFPVRGIVHVGSVVVPCFFVITAASLHRPFLVAQLRGDPAPSARRFWWKRFLRIYPLYAVALTTYLVLIPATRPVGGAVRDYLCLYALLQVYVPHLATHSGIPAAWFLCDEVGFYAVLPLLAATVAGLAARRSRRPVPPARTTLRANAAMGWALMGVGLAVRTGLLLAGRTAVAAWPIGNLDFYGFGMLLAGAGLRERAALPLPGVLARLRMQPWLAVAAWFAGLAVMTLVVREPGAVSSASEVLWRYAVYWLIILPFLTVMYLGPQRSGFNAWLASPALHRPSRLSLHIYLWQQLVLAVLSLALGDLAAWTAARPVIGVAALLAVTAAATTAWSALTSPVVDAPYRAWAESRPRPAPGTVAVVAVAVLAVSAVTVGAARVLPAGHDRHPIGVGRTWITLRDGTLLSAMVHLPGPEADGPYPTVIEYSGYQDGGPGSGRARPLVAAARRMGLATVSVTVPGIGCSGGRFELVGPDQAEAGRQVVAAVARQPWVRDHRVGLIGFSYGALGALEIAGTGAPEVAAVVALSAYGDAGRLFHPGGLTDDGFARGWLQSLSRDAGPAGPVWARERAQAGDRICAANLARRAEAPVPDLVGRYLDRTDEPLLRRSSPATWAAGIRAPVLVAGALQDAALGTDLADRFRHLPTGTSHLVLTDGTHADTLAPQVLDRVRRFLDVHLAGRAGTAELPPVEVLLESGNTRPPGAALAPGSVTVDTWPPVDTGRQRWPLGDGPGRFVTDPARAGRAYEVEGADLDRAGLPAWPQPDPRTTAAWSGPAVSADSLLLGTGRADLWVRSSVAGAQIQVSLTEVAPDGTETFITAAWATVPTAGAWTRVAVELGPLGEVLRAGTRLRVLAGTPGDGQVQRAFRPALGGPAAIEIGRAGRHLSTVDVPVSPVAAHPGARIATATPSCGALRGRPCRRYRPVA